MIGMDALNGRFGKGTLESATTDGSGPPRLWEMKQERKTPHYRTRLEDVPVMRA